MTPLEYLIPARPRRELLRTLRAETRGLTVRQLSRRVGAAYSNAHREVRLLTRLGLLRPERVGNALLCRWDPANPVAKALEPLFREGGTPSDDESLFWNLRRWGAPLAREGKPGRELSVEEALGRGLALARHHPDVARVWPVVFARNWPGVELPELELVARSLGQKKTLGFYLSLTGSLLKEPALGKFARRLRDGRLRRVEDFFVFPRGDRARRRAEENTPRVAREWLLRMNMPLESFETVFRKFE